MRDLKKLLALAEAEVGYQEKKNNNVLDDPDANAGRNNYTKYSRDVNKWGLAGCQGQPWCATYQFWLEGKIFGVEKALEHFHMNRKTYQAYNCFCIYDAFERVGKTSKTPEVGALIVFKHSHIGRVTAVKNGRVYTNEGNTSALYGDSNGGTVKNKDYSLNDSNIMGYCLMDYGESEVSLFPQEIETLADVQKLRVEEFQCWLNTWYERVLVRYCGDFLEEDGIYGPKTKRAAFVVWKDVLNRIYGCNLKVNDSTFDQLCEKEAEKVLLRKGDTGTLPLILEGILAAKGFYTGNMDAIFGEVLDAAVREFQQECGLLIDGIVGQNTWRAIFERI